MVGSWTRFWLMGLYLALAWACTVYLAATEGWRAAMTIGILFAVQQAMVLYALRRLYLIATGQESARDDGSLERRHFAWFGALLLAVAVAAFLVFRLARGF